jgi:hypothetical protein
MLVAEVETAPGSFIARSSCCKVPQVGDVLSAKVGGPGAPVGGRPVAGWHAGRPGSGKDDKVIEGAGS